MPLILICGTPLSGKSTRSKQLHEHFTKSYPNYNCLIVSDESKLIEVGPNVIYKNANQEKELRASLKSQIQRNLSSPETLVILDAANYIKGYRYELYCMCKLFKTTQVVIECLPPPLPNDTACDSVRQYSLEMIIELRQRFEPPNLSNRWDSPLFKIEFNQQDIPFEDIDNALFNQNKLKPNQSTQSLPLTTDNFMFELDSKTQDVIKQIQMALQNNQLRSIRVKESDLLVNLSRKMPIAELNKLRRQFINYTKMHPFDEKQSIVRAFVQFINSST